jgi:membrane protease YdiL (CAAX protease family)
METTRPIDHNCFECSEAISEHHRYCPHCGTYQGAQAVSINVFNNAALRQVFLFYFVYLFICLLVKHTNYFNSYSALVWIEFLLAAVTLGFAWQNRAQIIPLLSFKHFNFSIFVAVIAIAAGASFLVSLSVREVNITFFGSEVSYYNAFKPYYFPVVLMVWSIAVLPALMEELAFRGVMYNYCATFLDERLVVAVTAFLFAIMHLSLISLVWLIPFGFFIGNLRRRYNTLWYGVTFHFIFNLVACLIDLYREGQLFTF